MATRVNSNNRSRSRSSRGNISLSVRQRNIGVKLQQQELYLNNVQKQIDNLPDDIGKLQTLLKPLLHNIFIIDKYLDIQSNIIFNNAITPSKTDNIYTIPETQDKLDIEKYKKFLKFMITELYKNNTAFSQDSGEIITSYCINNKEEDKNGIEKIKEKYKKIYLDTTFTKPADKYPEWVTDLLDKSRDALYKEVEEKHGFKNILEQNDYDFINTLKTRIAGLKKCSEDTEEKQREDPIRQERQEYFKKEYDSEIAILPIDYTTEDKNTIDVKKKIKELCNNIYWGTVPYLYNRDKQFNFDKFYTFITTRPNESNFVKTFLPSYCFTKTDKGGIIDLLPKEDLKKKF